MVRHGEHCLAQIFSLLEGRAPAPADLAVAAPSSSVKRFTAARPALRAGLPVFPARFGFSICHRLMLSMKSDAPGTSC
jgi:hypothetical protein